MNKKERTGINSKDITIVTVTYGDRKDFVENLIKAVSQEQAGKLIIVDNGSEWEINLLKKIYGEFLHIINMGKNTGSAIGFSTGIEYAINTGAKYLWLLDDDNKPTTGSLKLLIKAYTNLLREASEDNLAVVSYRPAQQSILNNGKNINHIKPRPSCFHGFHLFDIPQKLMQRLPIKLDHTKKKLTEPILLEVAPYGGLFISCRVIDRIGLPRTDFILYEDDTEYTYRITKNKGKIFLAPSSIVEDIDIAWNSAQRFNNSFAALLCGIGDFKAYYNMRNCTYLDEHIRPKNKILFTINKSIYIMLLKFMSIKYKKTSRYKLLCEAIKDGINKKLGVKQGITISQPKKKPGITE